jgi:hypothetical protein
MNAKVSAVRAKFFRRYGEIDRLLKDIACGASRRLGRCVPMSE